MANESQQFARRVGTILASSNQSAIKYGLTGEYGSPIIGVPKMGDMWFIEFVDVESGPQPNKISSFAKTVSPITVSSDVVSVDRYGKRVHIPVYVNFPEVSVSLYDKVDGSGFTAANSMYSRFFKNADLQTDSGNLENSISGIDSGRKFTNNPDTSYIKSFRKIVIYHFFGNFGSGTDPSGRDQRGEDTTSGSIQKIEIINPLITSITFSASDYSDSTLRTVDLTFQPENVIFGTPTDNVAVPDWMKSGLQFIVDELDPSASKIRDAKLNSAANDPTDRDQRNTSELVGTSDAATASAQLERLSKLHTALKFLQSSPDATNEDRDLALSKFKSAISESMVMPASALNADDSDPIKNVITSELISDYMNGKQLNITNDLGKNLYYYNGKPLNIGNVNTNLNNIIVRSGKKMYNTSDSKFSGSLENASSYTPPVSNQYQGKNIAGEKYVPGQPMSSMQVSAINTAVAMGNPSPTGQELRDYKNGKALLGTDQVSATATSQNDLKQAKIRQLRDQTGGAR
jgi:hypothetical protein